MKILLIEPDLVLAKSYQQALAGHEVRLASSAATAVSILDEVPADLIITELRLGTHNGVEFLYELRSYADWQSIPVIIHTFVSPEALRLSGGGLAGLGVAEVLYKPATTLSKLRLAVGQVFEAQAA